MNVLLMLALALAHALHTVQETELGTIPRNAHSEVLFCSLLRRKRSWKYLCSEIHINVQAAESDVNMNV